MGAWGSGFRGVGFRGLAFRVWGRKWGWAELGFYKGSQPIGLIVCRVEGLRCWRFRDFGLRDQRSGAMHGYPRR